MHEGLHLSNGLPHRPLCTYLYAQGCALVFSYIYRYIVATLPPSMSYGPSECVAE